MCLCMFNSHSFQSNLFRAKFFLIGRERLPEEFSPMKHSITIYYFNSGTCRKLRIMQAKLFPTFKYELKVWQSSMTAFMKRNNKFHHITVETPTLDILHSRDDKSWYLHKCGNGTTGWQLLFKLHFQAKLYLYIYISISTWLPF